jgi:hypothetical protein
VVAEVLRINSMTKNEPARIPEPRPEDKAAVLFAELDVAQARGDFARAAEAQRQLEELGWVITRRRHRRGGHRKGVAE